MAARRQPGEPVAADAAEQVLALLGLARRAGKLALGATAAEKMVRQGARPIVVLAHDAGANQQRQVRRWQPVRGLVAGLVGREALAQRLGRRDVVVAAVADMGFVRGLRELGVVTDSGTQAAALRGRGDGRR